MPKSKKMPLDVEELLSSPRFQAFKDFQKWWFVAVICNMWNQLQPGYVEMTENFYRIVGAHSLPMWQSHGGAVMAAFERVERDGKTFLYSRKVEKLWHETCKKVRNFRAPAAIGSSFTAPIAISVTSTQELDLLCKEDFEFYRELLGKDSRYSLTEQRKKKYFARFTECLKQCAGDTQLAQRMVREAIQNLASSEWHRESGHTDWINQLFKSQEEFERKLAMKPGEKKHGNRAYERESEVNAAITAAIRGRVFGEAGQGNMEEVPISDPDPGCDGQQARGLGRIIPPARKGTV